MSNLTAPSSDNHLLDNYAKSAADRVNPDRNETILGHLVIERGISLRKALESLAPNSRVYHTQTETAKKGCAWVGWGGVAATVLLGSGLGVGFAILPAVTAAVSLAMWGDSKAELPRREAEYWLLKRFPKLPDFLWGLSLKGLSTAEIIGAYDALVAEYERALDEDETPDLSDAQIGQFLWDRIGNFKAMDALDPEIPTQQGLPELPTSPGELAPTVIPSLYIFQPMGQDQGAIDPVRFLAEEPKSQMIIGVTGGGKDLLMSNALRVLIHRFPAFTILVMDGKGDPKESGYWSGLPGVTHRWCCILESDRDDALAWIKNTLDEFKAMPSPKLLIVNEGTTVRGLDGGYSDFAVHVASGGDSSAIFVWESGQIAHTAALKIDGGRRSLFAPVALISKKRPDQVDALLATGFTPKDIKPQAFTAMDESVVGRAWFDGKQWLPLPRLENYSGYDRDDLSQKFARRETKGTVTRAEPTSTDRAKLEQLFEASKSLPKTATDGIQDALIDYIKKKGKAKVRDIQQARLQVLEGLKSSDIKDYLDLLVAEDFLDELDGFYCY
jgi:hypothetical protein